eukprot:4603487-Pleurochrysis_carterae.AAC.2
MVYSACDRCNFARMSHETLHLRLTRSEHGAHCVTPFRSCSDRRNSRGSRLAPEARSQQLSEKHCSYRDSSSKGSDRIQVDRWYSKRSQFLSI